MLKQIIIALLVCLVSAAAVHGLEKTPAQEYLEDLAGIQLPSGRGLRQERNTYTQDDFELAKSMVLEAARRMQKDMQAAEGRKLAWGLCWTFWSCDDSKHYTINDLLGSTAQAFDSFVGLLEQSGELDQLQAVIREWSSYDARFDLYTYIIAVTNSIEVNNWENNYQPHGRPNAKEHVLQPTDKQKDVPSVECGLAFNKEANAVIVPATDEHFQDVSRASRLLSFGIAENLGFPLTADICGKWNEGEDESQAIKTRLFGAWPEHRNMLSWYPQSDVERKRWGWSSSEDRFSDKALKQLVFQGIGQHRVQRVCTAASGGLAGPLCKSEDRNAPAGAFYALYLNFASGLEVRPGFAKLGADLYMDRQGNPIMIRRGNINYYPNGPQGNEFKKGVPEKCSWHFVWKWFNSYWEKRCCCGVPDTPAVFGWKNAKMAFRGTLSAVVTLVDHLYGLHLSVANAIVTANVEEMDGTHLLRRLLTPFGYRTEAINYRAAFALVNEFGLVHRGTPLTAKGIKDTFDFARTSAAGLTWATVPQRKAAKMIEPSMEMPLDTDGVDYYNKILDFVSRYFDTAFPENKCHEDAQIQRWMQRANSISPNHDLPTNFKSCDELKPIIASFMYFVSAGHRFVGTIAAELEDPCFAPWAWREDELCGTPRTTYTQILTMALTSHEQPRIMEDYTHMWDRQDLKNLWNDFTASLIDLENDVVARNAKRERPFNVFLPSQIETSIGI